MYVLCEYVRMNEWIANEHPLKLFCNFGVYPLDEDNFILKILKKN